MVCEQKRRENRCLTCGRARRKGVGGSSDKERHRICLAKKDPNIDSFCHTDIGSLLSVYMLKHYADQ